MEHRKYKCPQRKWIRDVKKILGEKQKYTTRDWSGENKGRAM